MEIRPATLEEVQEAQRGGTPLPLVPLGLDMHSCATAEEMHGNFYATLERGYEAINGYLGKESGKVCIFGAGPSIKETYKEADGDVIAINSAIGFLLDHGVVPRWAMLWDASPLVENFAVPHPDITYLVASRCHPKVFERLRGCKVVVWHAGGDHDIVNVLQRPEVIAKQAQEEPLINGGSAGVTRAIFVAVALGYRDLHIFGADSSYLNDDTHVRGSVVPEKDVFFAIGNNPPKWFRTTPEWAAQVEEYKWIYILAVESGIGLTPHGDGMLPYMHALLAAKRERLGHAEFVSQIRTQVEKQRELDAAASKYSAELSAKESITTQPLEANDARV